MYYIIYNKNTGDINRIVQCPADTIIYNYDSDTESYVVSRDPIDDRCYKVIDGVLTKVKEEEDE